MLQSEFFERTKVQLTSEEYIKVETLYSEVEMNKDEFCKQWLKLRNNPLMKETIEAFYKSQQMVIEIALLKKKLDEQKKSYEGAIRKGSEMWDNSMKVFAKKIILSSSDPEKVYDIVEEQYGIGFIIKAKREAGIPLSESEIDYMVGKL